MFPFTKYNDDQGHDHDDNDDQDRANDDCF